MRNVALNSVRGLPLLLALLAALGGCAALRPAGDDVLGGPSLVYIGSQGPQVTAARFDPRTGELALIGPVADLDRPTWAVLHPQRDILYYANEAGNDGSRPGSVVAFGIDRNRGTLAKLGEVDAGGGGTTFLWLDSRSATLLAANYGGGNVASIPLDKAGLPLPVSSLVQQSGSGPHRRQAGPHPHGIVMDREGRHVLVADLGADRVFVHLLDRSARKLLPTPAGGTSNHVAAPGSGPRHLLFHPSGRFVYLVNELSGQVQVLRWEAEIPRLVAVESVAIDSAEFTGTRSAASLALDRDGRFLYVSSRGEHTIVVFAVDTTSGKLQFVQRLPSGGKTPWHIALHPGGKWMLVSHQASNQVSVLSVDEATGRLASTGRHIETDRPVHVLFAR